MYEPSLGANGGWGPGRKPAILYSLKDGNKRIPFINIARRPQPTTARSTELEPQYIPSSFPGYDAIPEMEHRACRALRDSFDPLLITEWDQRIEAYDTHKKAHLRLASLTYTTWKERGNTFSSIAGIHTHNRFVETDDGPEEQAAIPRFKCSVEDCHWGTAPSRSLEHPFPLRPTIYCQYHLKKRSEVALGSVYKNHLPPELVKHVTDIINNPDGMSAREELATAKAITATLMRSFTSNEGDFDDPKKAAFMVQMLDKVTNIAEKQARISEKQDTKLNYKQVLVLISATVEKVLQVLGKNDDPKHLFLTVLPDLPWPAGVAKITGAEGLIGRKGELILPQKPAEKKLIIDAEFEGLDSTPREQAKPILEPHEYAPLVPRSMIAGAADYVPRIEKWRCPDDNFILYEDVDVPNTSPVELL